MAEEKKTTPTLEEALSKGKDGTSKASTGTTTDDTTKEASPTSPKKRVTPRIDKKIVEQENRLLRAQSHRGAASDTETRNPPSSHFPDRIALNEYNDRLAENRRKNKEGKSAVSDEKAKENKEAAKAFRENYENQPFSHRPGEWNELELRSTPGADDAPAFSTAEKVAGSGTKKPVVVVVPAMKAGTSKGNG